MTQAIAQATATAAVEGQLTPLSIDLGRALRVTDSGLSLVIGSTDDAAWDGEATDATVISLLKAIAINTAPA
jgi:hypothetical protein